MQQANRFDMVDSTRPQGPGIPDSLSQVLDDLFDTWASVRARNASWESRRTHERQVAALPVLRGRGWRMRDAARMLVGLDVRG